jgi:cyclopropane fatty-acyl-phospholipid synthase-like methyltransferase
MNWQQTKDFKYWQDRYSRNNNPIDKQAEMKAVVINHWINEYRLRIISEIGCGDGSNLLLYDIPISYSGYDISTNAINICKERTRKIRNSLKYYLSDDVNNIDYTSNVLLLIDVIHHVTDDNVFQELQDIIFNKGEWKYIIAYTYNTDDQFKQISHTQINQDGNSEVVIEKVPYMSHIKPRLFEQIVYNNKWNIINMIDTIQTTEGMVMKFDDNKRFYLLKR